MTRPDRSRRGDNHVPGSHESTTVATSGTDLGTAVVLFAATAVVVLGAGSGVPFLAFLAAVGGLLVGASVSVLETRSLARRAVGSGGLVVGIALGAAAVFFGGALAATALLASGATAVALVPNDGPLPVVRRAFLDSSVGAGVTAIAATIAITDAAGGVFALAVALVGLMTASAYAGFVSALILLAVAPVLVATAGTLLEAVAATDLPVPTLETLADHLSSVPKESYVVFVLFVIVLRFDGTAGTFALALEALGPVGTGLEVALTSGIVHVPLAVLAVVAAFVYSAVATRPLVATWLGSYPLRTLSLASGGVVATLLVFGTSTATGIAPPMLSVWAMGALLVAGLVFVEVFTYSNLTVPLGDWCSSRRLLGVGAGALFVMTVLGATIGLEPLLVFAGVAASIVLWDVGENALSMRTQFGERVDTRQPELVHATATAFVGIGSVVVAAVAMYGIGTVAPPSTRWQAVAPVVLALASVVVFALAVVRREGVSWPGRLPEFRDGVRQLSLPHSFSVVVFALLALSGLSFSVGLPRLGRLVLVLFIFALPVALLLWIDHSADVDTPPIEERL